MLTGLGGLAIVIVGGSLVTDGSIDSGVLPLLTLLAMSAFLPVSEIAQIGRQLADTLGATRRIYALDNEPVPVTDGTQVRPLRPTTSRSRWPSTASSFAYPGQNRDALADADIEVGAGTVVALVGTSGAGKTTAALLAMRFWDPERGRGHDGRRRPARSSPRRPP